MMAAEPLSMRLSTVTPTVEDSLSRVKEMVLLMKSGGAREARDREGESGGGVGGLTETQTMRLVGYMGDLEGMRQHLGTMAHHYQDDLDILSSLTTLLDRIDESIAVVNRSTAGYTHEEKGENEDGTLRKEEESNILRQSHLHQGSLAVSHSCILAVSGIRSLPSWLFQDDIHEHIQKRLADGDDDDDDGANAWDHPITADDLESLMQNATSSTVPVNLAQSFLEETEPPSTSSTPLVPEPTPSSSSSSSSASKNKKKQGPCEPTLCKICYEEYTNWSALTPLSNCDHIYCTECLSGFLHTRITSGGVLDLECPCPGCGAEVHLLDIYSVCTQDTLDKYERFMVLATLRADPNVRWCPTPTCSAPVHGPPSDSSPWITCTACQLQVCFACGDERHDPASCGKEAKDLIGKRHSAIRKAEQEFEEWHKGKPTDVKPCPKCKAYIEKNQGCNHMTCRSCKHQFCWLCLATYESSHFNSNNFPDCKGKQYWYPPVPPDPQLQQRYNWIYFPPNYQYAGVDDRPLGQQVRTGPSQSERIKTTAKKVGIYVGVGVAVVTLGIPAAVIGGPIYGVFKIHKSLKKRKARNVRVTENILI